MAFDPAITLRDVRLADLQRLNKLVCPDKAGEFGERQRPMQLLRAHHRKWMERVLIGHLSAPQYVVLSAIVSRTFGFGKIVEAIPLSVFSKGMRDPSDTTELHAEDSGMLYFAGTGLSVNAIRSALDELASRRVIERYRMVSRGRDTHAYMPVPFRAFYVATGVKLERDDIPGCFITGWDQPLTLFERQFLQPWENLLPPELTEPEEVAKRSPVSPRDRVSITS